MWSRVNENLHVGKLPSANPGVLSMANMFNPVFLVKTFTTNSDDWNDANHVKLIHTYGCKFSIWARVKKKIETVRGLFKFAVAHECDGDLRN